MEQELARAGRGPAGQCGPGREAETCPWLPSPGRGLVAEQAGARPGLPAQGVDLSSARKQGIQAGWSWPNGSICSRTTSMEATGGLCPGCRMHTGAVQAAPGWPPAAAAPGHPSMPWDISKWAHWGNLLPHPRARLSGVVSRYGAVKWGKLPGGKCREQNSGRRGDQFWGDQGWRETQAAPRALGS